MIYITCSFLKGLFAEGVSIVNEYAVYINVRHKKTYLLVVLFNRPRTFWLKAAIYNKKKTTKNVIKYLYKNNDTHQSIFIIC